MTIAAISKEEMKSLEKTIGDDLLKKHGKKKYYSAKEVKSSCESNSIAFDWHCWAMCFYTDHHSFDAFHESIGEVCDYVGMKTKMVSAITDGASDSWLDFDFDLSWMELPDFDFSSFFDFFDL